MGSDYQDMYQEGYEILHGAFVLGSDLDTEPVNTAFCRFPIPKTVKEAVQILMDELSLRDKVEIANMNADKVGGYHW